MKRIKLGLFGLLTLGLTMTLLNCGPDNKASDRQVDDIRDKIGESTKDYYLAEGKYVGTWVSRLGNAHPAVLNIFLEKVLKPLPPTNELIEVPTLRGVFYVYKENVNDAIFPLASYDGGSYSAATQELILGGQEATQISGGSPNPFAGGRPTLVGRLRNGNIKATAQLNGYETYFEGDLQLSKSVKK